MSDDLYQRAIDNFPSLKDRGLTPVLLQAFGVTVTDNLQLVIPLYDPYGVQVGVLVRTTNSDLKYISYPPEAKAYLYNLYYDQTCVDGVLVLFESPFDVMCTTGFLRAALIGVKLSPLGLDTLIATGCTKLILALDQDTAGQLGMLHLVTQLVAAGFKVVVYRSNLQIAVDYLDVVSAINKLQRPGFLLY